MGIRRAAIAGRVLDSENPVNWDHPLNRGLVSWWMPVPGSAFYGGLTLRDLCFVRNKRNNGTLTSGPTWTAGPGEFGSLRYVGASGTHVLVPYSPALDLTTDFTITGWMYRDTATGATFVAKQLSINWDYVFYVNLDKLSFYSGTTGGEVGALTVPTGKWFHGVVSRIGSNLSFYLDGVLDATRTEGTALAVNTYSVYLGYDAADSSARLTGLLADVRLYSRGMTSGEIASLYNQSRQGHLDTGNWLSRRTYFGTAVAAGIAVDAVSNSGYQAASSSYSWSHTCTGSNRYLAVDVGRLSVPGTTVTGITYNGVALSQVGTTPTGTDAGRIDCWGLANPASGSNTIAVTLSGVCISAGCAVSYTGVHQTSPTEAYAGATATNVGAADATVNITTVADNDWTHGALATDDGNVTANQTARNEVNGAGGSIADEDTGPKTPAGSVTASYTDVAALATWTIGAYAIRPVAAPSAADAFPAYYNRPFQLIDLYEEIIHQN